MYTLLQEKLAKEGTVQADPAQCERVAQAFAAAMAEHSAPAATDRPSAELPSAKRARADGPPAERRCRAVLFDLDDTLCAALPLVVHRRHVPVALVLLAPYFLTFYAVNTLATNCERRVMTSAIDREAIQAAAASMVGQREGEQVAGRFAALLKTEPFPPTQPGGTSVEEWRVRLWERAIGMRPPSVSRAGRRSNRMRALGAMPAGGCHSG